MTGIENEYTRFLSFLKVHPPKDNLAMKSLYNELFSFDAYISDVTRMYAKYYTPEEILELIKFNSSPLGLKSIQVNNEVNRKIEDLMLTKISDYVFTSAEHGFNLVIPGFN